MKDRDHKKIARLKRKLNRLCDGIQVGGVIGIIAGFFGDYILWFLQITRITGWHFNPGISVFQLVFIGAGVFMFLLGWYVRR